MNVNALVLLLLLILAFTLVTHLGILANPGFNSHDEWERLENVRMVGLRHYIALYSRIHAGPEFAFPIRPIGFFQQGFTVRWMETAPFVTHLFDVLLHAGVAGVLFLALATMGLGLAAPLTATLVFVISPMTTVATGWPAASFDQWYVLFFCFTCWAAWQSVAHRFTIWRGLCVLVFSACAMLSKESSLVLPGAVVLTMAAAWLLNPPERPFPWRTALLVLLLTSLPIAAYLGIRWPAIEATLAGHATAYYTPSFESMRHNLVAFFTYPFLPLEFEMTYPLRVGIWDIVLAAALHLALLAAIAVHAGWRFALLYLAAYVLMIALAVGLPMPSGHYLYGAAVPHAIALGFLLHAAWVKRWFATLALCGLGLVLMGTHMVKIQQRLYRNGLCQTTFFTSLDGRLAGASAPLVIVTPHPEARGWVARRAVHAQPRYSGQNGAPLVLIEGDERIPTEPPAGTLRVVMGPRCHIR